MRLFVDMDGTIAKWNNVAFEDLYQEGYYKNLEPDSAILDEVKMLIELNIDVYILSAYLPDIYDDNTGELIKKSYALQDKQEWIEKYLPEINKDNVIFVPYGTNKAEYLKENYSPVYEDDYLLDDYTNNLNEWEGYGGTGIKYRNGINGTKGTWKGLSVEHTEPNLFATIPETSKILDMLKSSYAVQSVCHIDNVTELYNFMSTISFVRNEFVSRVNPKNIKSIKQLIETLSQEGYEYSVIDETPSIVDVYLDDCTVTYYIKEKECTIPDIEVYSNADTIASVSLENAEKLFDDIQDATSYLNNDTIDNDYHMDY